LFETESVKEITLGARSFH